MKLELLLILITGGLVYNTYYDGYIVELFKINKKYLHIAGYIFIALTAYIFFKKRPNDTYGLLQCAHNIIRYMPIDKDTSSYITPLFDFTQNMYNDPKYSNINETDRYVKRMMKSGGNKPINAQQKRCVSQSKKRLVASQQKWNCGHCNNQLDHTFEIDHIVDLQFGGTNEVSNLVALCRNCHGKKTINSKL